jgi:hypothetical protein
MLGCDDIESTRANEPGILRRPPDPQIGRENYDSGLAPLREPALNGCIMKTVPVQGSLFGQPHEIDRHNNEQNLHQSADFAAVTISHEAILSQSGGTLLPIDGVSKLLGVSSATVRNWVRAGHILPSSEKPLLFAEPDVRSLKERIASGMLSRLRTRANKSVSQATRIPKEYVTAPGMVTVVERVLLIVEGQQLDLSTTMFVVALRLLDLKAEMHRYSGRSILDLTSYHSWKRRSTEAEMVVWHATLGTPIDSLNVYEKLYSAIADIANEDLLGVLYQSIRQEGERSNKGSYYTPSSIVAESLAAQPFSGRVFLDPCCGTGQYLVQAAKFFDLSPENIYGCDIDETAVRIARINYLLAFPEQDRAPQISCLNFISQLATGELCCETNGLLGQIDCIATNPPWGAFKNSQVPLHLTHGIRSNEAFSLFLAKSLRLLSPDGILSFILPESILKIRAHSDIRERILNTSRIVRITKLGRPFSGVFTEVIRMDIKNGTAPSDWFLSVIDGNEIYEVPQRRFSENDHCAFDVGVTENEDCLIRKLYSVRHCTLAGNAEWALGIVTGDNNRFISKSPGTEVEPVYRGSDILQYGFKDPATFIRFAPSEYQQVAKESLYRAKEKLIYKFISSHLAFAYDDQQRLTVNSANIVIPRLPGVSMKVALAFLNSKVFQYLAKKKFNTHKVLKGDLERLPFPVLSSDDAHKMEKLVEALHEGADARADIERLVASSFELTEGERRHIEKALKEG